MRSHHTVDVGQTWKASDPRRLRLFRVRGVVHSNVIVQNLYPIGQDVAVIPVDKFLVTGTKGYTRVA